VARIALAGGLVAGAFAVGGSSPDADAAQTLYACSGFVVIEGFNPTVGSGDAKYNKGSLKKSDGTKLDGFGSPIPADATTCLVDSGIRTNQAGQDVKYLLDDQTGGNTVLTLSGTALGKLSGTLAGSASCNSTDPTLDTDYPTEYPAQGKLVFKYDQIVAGKQLQSQQYVRFDLDPADTNPQHRIITGTVIKGVGVAGDITATVDVFPTNSSKNSALTGDLLDCVANPALGVAVIAEVRLIAADGTDVDALDDPWLISIPS
jgi:hypothetical protein